MRRIKDISCGKNEPGTIITLVAVFMLFVIGAMAALSIDVVTIYTARSEAQLAADAAALAGARVLANSGLTSTGAPNGAETSARAVATQVAESSQVGGRSLNASGACTTGAEISVCFNDGAPNFATDPHITVTVQRSDLPTFFARIWGRTQLTVAASATAEAYNPSNATGLSTSTNPPVAPLCVKPWLLPNIDPTQTTLTATIFDSDGEIVNTGLVGLGWPNTANTNGIYSLCGSACSLGATGTTTPSAGAYYPGATDAGDFPAPASASIVCSNGASSASFNAYQLAVAGCVQQPIVCGANSSINIDTTAYGTTRDADTVAAAECLIHYVSLAGDSDSVESGPPFQFLGGNQNPIAGAVGKNLLVSDSLVTIPVINTTPGVAPANPVQVIGFLQVFLNPQAATMPLSPVGPASSNEIPAMIINMAGCGTGSAAQPILGNGASPVAVRLISPP